MKAEERRKGWNRCERAVLLGLVRPGVLLKGGQRSSSSLGAILGVGWSVEGEKGARRPTTKQ